MDINVIREEMRELAKEVSIDAIAQLYKMTPEQVKIILDGGEIQVAEEVQDNQPVMVFKAVTRVHLQKVFAVWRTRGGVGATAAAITLAKMVSDKMKTLLICCNFASGGSDLIKYLDLPYFPKTGFDNLHVLPVQGYKNLWVIPPVTYIQKPITKEQIQSVILKAREEFDAIVLDLPNSQDEGTMEAARCATHLVWVVGSGGQEAQRVQRLSAAFDKEQYFIANGINKKELLNVITADIEKVIEIPFDNTMEQRLEKNLPLSMKSPFWQGMARLYEAVFKEKPEDLPEVSEGKFSELRGELAARYRRFRRKTDAVVYKVRSFKTWLWHLIETPFYITATLIVVFSALLTLDHQEIVHVPFAREALNRLVETITKM
ncbi:MAG: AAA family ATPase [Bacillota bacterium]